ncbi:MAG: hypothetical protein AAF901_10780, partial [Bacteroidota bacterium]
MKKLIIALLLFNLWSCKKVIQVNEEVTGAGEIVISGEILNYDLNDSISTIAMYSYDRILNQDSYDFDIDPSGRFEARFSISHQQDINLYYKNWLTLILKPGDSLKLTFNGAHKDKEELYTSAIISGNAEQINNHLFSFLKSDDYKTVYYDRIRTIDPEGYITYHDSLFGARNAYIDNFITTHPKIDTALEDWLVIERELAPAQYLLEFPLNYRMFNP